MKRFIMLPTVAWMIVACLCIKPAWGDSIYIYEPSLFESGKQYAFVSSFDAGGKQRKRLTLKGFMAKVSPDEKRIAYVAYEEGGFQRLVVANSRGKKIYDFDIFEDEITNRSLTVDGMEWSPDGKKMALLLRGFRYSRGKGRNDISVDLALTSVASNDISLLHRVFVKSDMEAFLCRFMWFPDAKRVLFSGGGETRIIDTGSESSIVLAANASYGAYLTGDAKTVFYLSGDMRKTPPEIFRYEVENGKEEKLLSLPHNPAAWAFSPDGKWLYYTALRDNELFVVDLATRKIDKMNTKDLEVLPLEVSPVSNRLVGCLGLTRDSGTFGIFDTVGGTFKPLKNLDSPGVAMIYMMMLPDLWEWRNP